MNLRHAFLVAGLVFATSLRADEPPFEFSGVMTTGGKTRVALTDPSTKTTTWLEPGQQFRGYTIARYDANQDVVFLKKAGQETRLALSSAKTSDAGGNAGSSAASLAAEATANAIRANLRLLTSAARQYQLEHGVMSVSYSDLVGPGKPIKEIKPVAGENYSTLTFGPNVTGVNVTTATGTVVALDLPSAVATAPSSVTLALQSAEPPPNTSSLPGATAPSVNPSNTAAPVTAPGATGSVANSPAAASGATAASPVADTLQPTGRQPLTPNYAIQAGDTWEKISTTTGVPVQQLKQMNPSIMEGAPLPSGQMIRVR
jgi:LysM repeat protein